MPLLPNLIALILSAASMLSTPSTAPDTGMVPVETRRSIAEARRLVRDSGSAIWPKISRINMPIMVVMPNDEYLFCAKTLSGFRRLGRDAISGCYAQQKARDVPVDASAATGGGRTFRRRDGAT